MKKKIILGIIIVLILGIIGGAIYWYEVYPAMNRNQCNWEAYEPMLEVWGKNKTSGASPIDYRNYYELMYQSCLRNKGIK